jgi:hypothetical protein
LRFQITPGLPTRGCWKILSDLSSSGLNEQVSSVSGCQIISFKSALLPDRQRMKCWKGGGAEEGFDHVIFTMPNSTDLEPFDLLATSIIPAAEKMASRP